MSGQRRYEDVLADAVRVLTEAARHTVTWCDEDGREHHHHADFAEFVTHAVAGAAANVGGVEEILFGRSGSWEADHVRQMLQSTVGCYEEYLVEHRTEPLTVVVAVDNLLFDVGFAELFEQAHDELDRREEAICAEADTDRPMLAVTDLPDDQQVALEQIDCQREALHRLKAQEWVAYGEAFKANVLHVAGEMLPRLQVPVVVEVHLDWHDEDSSVPPWGPAFAVWERARDLTPLPGSGIPLKDYPLGDVAQIERDAGRDPLRRLRRGEVRA
jgi:hypothetical protein